MTQSFVRKCTQEWNNVYGAHGEPFFQNVVQMMQVDNVWTAWSRAIVSFPSCLWQRHWLAVVEGEVAWLEDNTTQLCFVKPRWAVNQGLKYSEGARWGAQIWFRNDEDILAYSLVHSDRVMHVRKFEPKQMELYMSNVT
jgi:hypothetical protein